MQVLINVLCFFAGVVSTLGVLLTWAWYLRMQERIALAESAKKEMEATIKLIEEQQKDAALALQNSISELVKRRTPHQHPAAAPQMPQDSSANASVKERLRKAIELTSKQSRLDVKKGHEFVMQHNELELEKLAVLKSILADGFDPVITIRYNTGDQEILLSNYIQSITRGLA